MNGNIIEENEDETSEYTSSNNLPRCGSEVLTSLTPNAFATTRVQRLLQERLRRSRSSDFLRFSFGEQEESQSVYELYKNKILVVANRLPVSVQRNNSGQWELQVSAGGLVSALKGVSNYQTKWVGWPGVSLKSDEDRRVLTGTLNQHKYYPVWLPEDTVDLYYNGFCNTILWSLFHYVPLPVESSLSETKNLQKQWQAYQEANKLFAEQVCKLYEDGDVVWIQDYHLMCLPQLLKEKHPNMKIGFFLHTPFPSSEIYRTLPCREDLLSSVIQADLIGFHTYDYARHFLSSCTRILGKEGTPDGVDDNGRIVRIACFPIGIDATGFEKAFQTQYVQDKIRAYQNRFAGKKIMLGVDRLDMIKGLPQKLLAFEDFLINHEDWRDKVVLIQIAVPSRTDVAEYQKLRSTVHEIVGRINGSFSSLTHAPIIHLDQQLSFYDLVALYSITDVALVTSQRDGMNLVSYEFVACQNDNAGVLILSEFAGAAQSLGAGALLVNPWNVPQISKAIEHALTMSEQERRERHSSNYTHVMQHTAQEWADTYISELLDTQYEKLLHQSNLPPQLDLMQLKEDFQLAHRRLLIFGYNATLTESGGAQQSATWRQNSPYDPASGILHKTLNALKQLTQDTMNTVIIFSGTTRSKMQDMFNNTQFWLMAENGVYLRPPCTGSNTRPNWIQIFENMSLDWMESVKVVFNYFNDRTPRSSVEIRETSILWSYRYADVEFGRVQARDLLQHLWTGPISNASVDIVQGGKSVEARPVGVTKGTSLQKALCKMEEYVERGILPLDFVLCVGHFLKKDENIFSYLDGHDIQGQQVSQDQRPGGAPKTQALGVVKSESDLSAKGGYIQNFGKYQHPIQVKDCIEFPPKYLYTCTVGRSSSKAQYSLKDSYEVGEMIQVLAGKDPESQLIWQQGD